MLHMIKKFLGVGFMRQSVISWSMPWVTGMIRIFLNTNTKCRRLVNRFGSIKPCLNTYHGGFLNRSLRSQTSVAYRTTYCRYKQ